MIAMISNKRPHTTQNGTHICAVTCPNCEHTQTVSYGGWTALVCPACKVTLHRNAASVRYNPQQYKKRCF